MDLRLVRETVIVAIAGDEVLFDLFVLKGGNALEIVYKIGQRASLDIDYSLDADIDDMSRIAQRLNHALTARFAVHGQELFDFTFDPRPSEDSLGTKLGGYLATFKLLDSKMHQKMSGDIEAMRRNATVIGANSLRKFEIEISKYEYTKPKHLVSVATVDCYVYTPPMIAVEKLRAICQQMPYPRRRRNPTARPRDFYDIHSIVTEVPIDLVTHGNLLKPMFEIKEVPLSLLGDVHTTREDHRAAWPAVEAAVSRSLKPFDFYFDFVVHEIVRLQPFWKVHTPALIK